MSFNFGCSNCNDMMQHSVYRGRNPFIDETYHFCNHCGNENAIKEYNKMRIILKLNNLLKRLHI